MRRPRYVLLWPRGDRLFILLERYVWIDLLHLARGGTVHQGLTVWVFRKAAAADLVRKQYGGGLWRQMEVERVRD